MRSVRTALRVGGMVRKFVRALVACAIVACFTAQSASAAVFVVNTTADGDDPQTEGVCHAPAVNACTLRAAIQEANDTAGVADTVSLPAGRYELTAAGGNENFAVTGDLDLTGSITIAGAGARTTIIDANGIDRVFHVPGSTTGNVI